MLGAIILFGAVAAFMLFGSGRPGDSTRALVRSLREACDVYRADWGEYPPVAFGDSRDLHLRLGLPYLVLVQGYTLPVEKKPYVQFPSKHLLPTRAPCYVQDEWDRALEYRNPGTRDAKGVDIWSLGPKADAAGDDIASWDLVKAAP